MDEERLQTHRGHMGIAAFVMAHILVLIVLVWVIRTARDLGEPLLGPAATTGQIEQAVALVWVHGLVRSAFVVSVFAFAALLLRTADRLATRFSTLERLEAAKSGDKDEKKEEQLNQSLDYLRKVIELIRPSDSK